MKSAERCETVYDIFVEMMQSHKSISGKLGHTDTLMFNLQNKTIHNGVISFVDNGVLVCDRIELTDGTTYEFTGKELVRSDEDFYETVEKLYHNFKYSVPTKRDNKCRGNFTAKHPDDLSFDQLMNGEKRPIARCKLEAYVILMAMTGQINWKNNKHFFWQSNNDKELILFREWCA